MLFLCVAANSVNCDAFITVCCVVTIYIDNHRRVCVCVCEALVYVIVAFNKIDNVPHPFCLDTIYLGGGVGLP